MIVGLTLLPVAQAAKVVETGRCILNDMRAEPSARRLFCDVLCLGMHGVATAVLASAVSAWTDDQFGIDGISSVVGDWRLPLVLACSALASCAYSFR